MTVIPFPPQEPRWEPADAFVDPADRHVQLFADRANGDQWRVEYEDEDGASFIAIFAGRAAESRAREYLAALKSGRIDLV